MRRFRYAAITPTGPVWGTLTDKSKRAAARQLKARGYSRIRLQRISGDAFSPAHELVFAR